MAIIFNLIFEVCVIVFLARLLSDRREITLKGILLLAAIGISYILIDMFMMQRVISSLKTLMTFFIIMKLYYKNSILKSIFNTILFMCVVMISDLITSTILTYITRNTYDTILENTKLMGSYINDFITLSLMTPICIISKRKYKSLPVLYWITLVLFPVCGWVVLVMIDYLLKKAAVDNPYYAIVPAIVILYLNIVMFIFFETYSYKMELEALKQKEEYDRKHAKEINEMYARTCAMRHDLLHHFETVKGLLGEDSGKAKEYLQSVTDEQIRSIRPMIKTDNDYFDAIANAKLALCDTCGIKVATRIMEGVLGELSNSEIASLFGNLFDNAIEASKNSKEKRIELDVQRQKGQISVFMRNTIDKSVLEGNKKLETTKAKSYDFVGYDGVWNYYSPYGGSMQIEIPSSYKRLHFADGETEKNISAAYISQAEYIYYAAEDDKYFGSGSVRLDTALDVQLYTKTVISGTVDIPDADDVRVCAFEGLKTVGRESVCDFAAYGSVTADEGKRSYSLIVKPNTDYTVVADTESGKYVKQIRSISVGESDITLDFDDAALSGVIRGTIELPEPCDGDIYGDVYLQSAVVPYPGIGSVSFLIAAGERSTEFELYNDLGCDAIVYYRVGDLHEGLCEGAHYYDDAKSVSSVEDAAALSGGDHEICLKCSLKAEQSASARVELLTETTDSGDQMVLYVDMSRIPDTAAVLAAAYGEGRLIDCALVKASDGLAALGGGADRIRLICLDGTDSLKPLCNA